MKKSIVRSVVAALLLAATLISCQSGGNTTETTTTGRTKSETTFNTTPNTPAAKQLAWPDSQIFPTFKAPTDKLDGFPEEMLSDEEKITVTCLEGLVNSVQTRMVVLNNSTKTWLSQYGYRYTEVSAMGKFDIYKKYASEISGVVLYSAKLNPEYINLACTVANTLSAIPITENLYKLWLRNGIELPVVEDLRDLTMKSTVDIHKYLFENYWDKCNKKILLVQRTGLYNMRDLAAACGSAVVHLSCAGNEETRLFKKMLLTMTPGESIMVGWYEDQERELMTVGAQCGISCVPADFFSNPTVFSQDINVNIKSVPDMPALENKIYIALYFSDGDNIQYNMNAMREYWNSNSSSRGKIPVNWTISPALVDIAPGMMNYYYEHSTDSDCFVCGPSGMGYTMPMNTWGPNTGEQFKDTDKFKAYIELTNRYLQQSGLRVVTIWDNLSTSQRNIYSSSGTYLYGLTTQNFTNASLSLRYTSVNNNMLIQQLTPGYFASNAEGTTPITDVSGDIRNAVSYLGYDGTFPVFVSLQIDVWAFHQVSQIVTLRDYLEGIYGEGKVEFVRADHYYNLYYEANGLPVDVTLKPELKATATSNSDAAILTTDGTPSNESIWQAAEAGEQSVTYDLGAKYLLSEIAILHAETNGFESKYNSKAFKVEISSDNENWKEVASESNNTQSWSTLTFDETEGQYVRITITDAGSGDGIARIADVNIYGKVVK